MLFEDRGALFLQSQFPKVEGDDFVVDAHMVTLEPADDATDSVYDDVRSLFTRAIHYVLANDEFLVVEKGGWDAPFEPFCLFIVIAEGDDFISVVETAPAPHGSELREPHIVAGRESNTLSAPASRETIDFAAVVMMEAIATWGLQPWDLALTFGQR